MKRRWPLIALIAAACVFVIPAHASRTSTADNPHTFSDTPGDSGTAPDIRDTIVSNDANGVYRFRINLASFTVPSDVLIVVFLDTDLNASTGSGGYDYALVCDESNDSVGLLKWDGAHFVAVDSPTLNASDDGGGVTLTINRTDIGGAGAFNLEVDSLEGNGDAGHSDFAPDTGTWNYVLGPAAAARLAITQATAPKTVKSGKSFLVAVLVTRADTGEFVNDEIGGSVSCAATIGKKRVVLQGAGFIETTSPEQAGCLFRAPKKARGKTIRATITVTLQSLVIRKTFAVKVK